MIAFLVANSCYLAGISGSKKFMVIVMNYSSRTTLLEACQAEDCRRNGQEEIERSRDICLGGDDV